MKKQLLKLAGVVGLMLASSLQVKSQVFILEDFDQTGTPPGWSSVNFFNSNTNPCDERSMRRNFWSSGTTGSLASPAVLAEGNDIDISFDYKIIDFSGGGATSGNFGLMNLQYSIDGGTSWTTYSTIEESNHTPSTACVTVSSTIVGADVPAASNFAWRLDGTWSSGDYYFYVDNFLAVEDGVCVPPNNVIASLIEENSITIGWDQFGTITTGWNVEYGLAGFTQGSGTLLTVTSQEALVGGLDPNTEYDFYVQGDCSADQSTWTGPSTFTTACSLTSATFTEDFDAVSTPEVPNCWTAIAVGANQFVRCRTITTANPNSGPNHVEMYNSATNGAAEHVMLVGPGVNDLSSGLNQIRFFAKRGTNVVDLEIGTMSDPTDPTTFTLYETISNLTTTHEQYVVTLDNYTGTDEYFVFKHANTAATQYVYIDDVIWEPIPTCPLPSNLEATNITLTEADLSWVDNAGASQWEVEWGAEGFVLGNGTNSTETTTSLSLTGLTDGTTYEFYVRADCGGDFSDWQGPFAFSTVTLGSTCGASIIVNTLPYFDSGNTADYGDNYESADRPALGTEQYSDGTGSGLYLNGDDVVYSFTPTQSGLYNFGLENIGTWVGFWLFEGCDPFTEIVAYHTATTSVPRLMPNIQLTAGTTYYVVISTWPTPQSTTYDLTICQSEDASFEYQTQLLCELETSYVPNIIGELGGAFASGTGLTLDPSTGEINPSTSDAGTYEVVYTTNSGICSGTDTVTVEIAGIEDASFEYNANFYCILDDNAFPLVTGQTGGEFSAGAGLAINNSTGEINPATSSPGNYTVEYTSSTTACATTESWDIEIVMNENASFNYSSAEFCQNYMDITPSISGAQGGTFSAESGLAINAQTGQIGAEASSIGTFWVYYTTPGQDCPATDSVQISIQECLSIDENTISQIEVYPNPARDIVNVSLPTVQGTISIEVMDATGKLVMNKTVNGNVGKEQLNIINLDKGVYMIRFTGNEMNTTKRIVVTK